MLQNEHEKYCVVVSESKIWVVQNKYYGTDLRKESNKYEAKQSLKLCTAIDDAQEALRTAVLAFKEGFGTSLQVTDAQMMLSKVKIERLNAVYNYDVNLTDLLKTNGDTNSILEYIKVSSKEKF